MSMHAVNCFAHAQVTALEIQALKRVNKGTKVLLLDKSGSGTAKNVAKELAKLGFGGAYVISGGFQGWTSSKLQVKAPVRPPASPR
jgi:rhodanese-related sulfurtransferase